MNPARYLVGDVFDGLNTLEDNSVDLVFSSPPFLALRSYLPADHPDKAREIGSEPTPAAFLDTLLDVVEACDRVLAPHGSLCFELGDSFSGSGGAGGDYNADGLRDGQQKFSGSASKRARLGIGDDYRPSRAGRENGWPLDKSLCLIPTLFAASLAYGYNMLRPERTTPRWRVRNLVVWARPNPPVGALGDKFRPATSYVTVACKSRSRYFDLDAVRTPVQFPGKTRTRSASGRSLDRDERCKVDDDSPAGAPPLDYWEIPTHPYAGSHYATFPPDLVVKPVKAMCPLRVCRVCGEPSRRIVSEPEYPRTDTDRVPARLAMNDGARVAEGVNQHLQANGANTSVTRTVETLGWSDCGHDDWRPGLVLDPFAGSGTVGQVATGHGRDCVMIDLDARNADLALERVGPLLLSVEHLSLVESRSQP